MSVQACFIQGFGYKFNYDDILFGHIDNTQDERNFLEIINHNDGYYSLRDGDDSDKLFIRISVVTDGMFGEYKYVLFITHAHYLENTHGDERWSKTFRNDDFLRESAKERIETFLRRKLDTEPQEHQFEHWS